VSTKSSFEGSVLLTKEGKYFSYVIDVGNEPSTLFPDTDDTEKWHTIYKNTFPDFSFEKPVFKFEPESKSPRVTR
jgi:hypothetical protein